MKKLLLVLTFLILSGVSAQAYGPSTGTGLAVLNNGPTLVAPILGTPASGVVTNLSGTANAVSIGGTAAVATTGTTASVSNSASYYPLLASSTANSNQAFKLGTGLSFNPSTNALTTTTFIGALTGNASTVTSGVYTTDTGTVTNTMLAGSIANAKLSNAATTVNGQTCTLGSSCTITASAGTVTVGTTTVASGTDTYLLYNNAAVLGNVAASTLSVSNSTNVGITDDTTTNATMYPTWVTTTTGNLPEKISSSKMTFNPSTATLTVANLAGNSTTATTLATTRAIYGNNFNGSAALDQIIASTYGGTGNGFTKFTGPSSTEKTFTLPNASSTLLYSGGDAGTPSALVCTNCSGTASSLTAGAVAVGGITGLGSNVGTFLATPSSANFAAAVTGETGTGGVVFSADPSFTSSISNSGTTMLTRGSTLTIASGVITATATTHAVDTEGSAATDDLDTITAGTSGQILYIRAASGARDVVIKNNTGNILTPGGADITLDVAGIQVGLIYDSGTSKWNVMSVELNTTNLVSSNIAIASATSLTTATAKSITSISVTPGTWIIWGNIGFISAAGTIPTVLTASISTTDNTQATSPNAGAYAQIQATLGTAGTDIVPTGMRIITVAATTTYYLVATATFTVSTETGYGYIGAQRIY